MSDADLMKLYSQRILALAADIPGADPLPAPDAQAEARALLCGSTIKVALTLDGDTVSGFSQQVRACALGQASASIFGRHVIGCTEAQVAQLRTELEAMLKGGPVPSAPFADYEVLIPARDYPNRHASILLAPTATLKALAEAH